ncbi:protein BatD [bacterium]|nr:protein BatD [bacterium]
MKFVRSTLLTMIFGAAAALGQGQVSIESKVDRAKINIGDVITYSVIITHDADVHLEQPSPGKNLGQFEIRGYQVVPPRPVGRQIVSRTDYQISTFDVGEFDIPSLRVYYRTGQDTTLHHLRTEVITITVASLNPNEKGDIRDIKPPMTPPRDLKRIVLAVCAVVILLSLFGLGWWYYRRRKQGQPLLPVREKPRRPAHEIALEALAELEASDWLAVERIKDYYVAVSEIIRRYVSDRYFIDAMEMTTSQLMSRLQEHHLDQEPQTLLQSLLELSDLVKFAKYIPAPEVQQQTVPQARAFVHATKLVLEEPEPAAAEAASPVPASVGEEA